MKLTHLGHACVLVDMADTRILIDPGEFSDDFTAVRDLDAVLITHQHPDHYDKERLPDLMRANPAARLICDPQTLQKIADLGLDATTHEAAGERIGQVEVTPVGTKHAQIHEDLPIVDNVGVRLAAAGEPVLYHPGDTLAEDPGQIDLLLFPLTAPWQKSAEMVTFLRRLAPRRAVPIHDAIVSAAGRGIYVGHARNLGPQETEVLDLLGAGEQVISRE
ncbi:MBL fold metallo-hydrolase [Nostocoides australiense]|nr:MBL fold metallo-hydrolase [Tetrasphaera australiensis]